MAPDSSWFPAKLQDNLLKTLAFVLGSTMSPPATEGINAIDFFHGHLVIKKDPATDTQAKSAVAASDKFRKDLKKARTAAIGDVQLRQRLSYDRQENRATTRRSSKRPNPRSAL